MTLLRETRYKEERIHANQPSSKVCETQIQLGKFKTLRRQWGVVKDGQDNLK